MTTCSRAAAAVIAASLSAGPALAFDGSFGSGFDRARYVPPVTMPTLSETPFITSEVKPIGIYHSIPNGFVTGGGDVYAGAVQARFAVTDRIGIIATTDGYADINFDGVLPDTDGFLDIAAGAKYAIVSDPEAGNLLTAGLRYTAPVGNVETAGIDLTGSSGNGYIDVFLTGATLLNGGTNVQGSIGYQVALSDENWSYIHVHGHIDHEIAPNFFPLLEFNAIIPTSGGDRIPGANLTGADVFDIGASDPVSIVTLAIGARYRVFDNMVVGAAFEGNVADVADSSAESVYGWRITTDLTIHF